MPIPIKRRAYIKILGLGQVHITTSYDNKVFSFEKGVHYIDLISLKVVDISSFIENTLRFEAKINYNDDAFTISVFNNQDSCPHIGTLSSRPGSIKEKDFRCTIVE